MGKSAPLVLLLIAVAACRQQPGDETPAAEGGASDEIARNLPDADINASLADIATEPVLADGDEFRFAGRWATDLDACAAAAWTVSADNLRTPAGAVCRFAEVRSVPGGYDINARCTGRGDERLELRFAESAGALLVESETLGQAGLIPCPE